MENKVVRFFSLLAALALVVACKRNAKDLSVPTPATSATYYPLQVGSYRLYDVQKATYRGFERSDTSYQLKVLMKDTWVDLEGTTSYTLYRYKKLPGASDFGLDSIWHVRKTAKDQLVVTENNVPLVKLALPVAAQKSWNGNLLNAYPQEWYSYQQVGSARFGFRNTVTVESANDTNLLARKYRAEVYGLDVGLVYKEDKNVAYSTSGADFGKGVIEKGYIYKQTLVGYGNE